MDVDALLALGSLLSQLPDRTSYLQTVRQQLLRLIPADDVLWIQASDGQGMGCVVIHGDPWTLDEGLSRDLGRCWTRHVTTRWGSEHLTERRPFRVSDIIAPEQWRREEVYRELRAGMAEFQLNIISPPPVRYRGWVLTRSVSDFPQSAVETAAAIAPVLAVLGQMYDRLEPWLGAARSNSHAVGLTLRERDVLGVLAEGLSADAMGRRLGISERTVGKHLEHIYRKLDCNDRLVAIARTHELGLLPGSGEVSRAAVYTQKCV